MKDWEIIAEDLSKAGFSWGCVSAIDSNGRTIWIADEHQDNGGTARAFAQAKFRFSIQPATSSASSRSTTRIESCDVAILPLPAGTLTQLEMSQKRLYVLGKTLGHTPSLGVFCWPEVIDFDRFFGFLFLVLHACYFSFADILAITSAAIVLWVAERPVKRNARVERFNAFLSRVA